MIRHPMKNTFMVLLPTILLFLGCEENSFRDDAMKAPETLYPVYDIDGNGYDTVRIGTQTWTVQNLRVSRFNNGDSIPNGYTSTELSHLVTPAIMIYDDDSSYSQIYGFLYNWYAVTDSRGLAPEGWHVPSNIEWEALSSFLGGDSMAGGKLKHVGIDLWHSPNTGATNETGFTGLPGGWFSGFGGFYGSIRSWGTFYSITSHDFANSYSWGLLSNSSVLSHGIYYKQAGRSVRCIKTE